MNRKHAAIGIAILVITAAVFFFWNRNSTSDVTAASVDSYALDSVDPAVSGNGAEEALMAPIDHSARWGFVLFDGVKMVGREAPLNSGDQVYIGEGDPAQKGQTKVTLADGASGFIDRSKIFEATSYAEWSILDSSTAPIKTWIPAEMVPAADREGYRALISSDFLMRASKNPNGAVADWASAVLSAQAEGAAQ